MLDGQLRRPFSPLAWPRYGKGGTHEEVNQCAGRSRSVLAHESGGLRLFFTRKAGSTVDLLQQAPERASSVVATPTSAAGTRSPGAKRERRRSRMLWIAILLPVVAGGSFLTIRALPSDVAQSSSAEPRSLTPRVSALGRLAPEGEVVSVSASYSDRDSRRRPRRKTASRCRRRRSRRRSGRGELGGLTGRFAKHRGPLSLFRRRLTHTRSPRRTHYGRRNHRTR